MIRVNLLGTFNCIRLAAAAMSATDPLAGIIAFYIPTFIFFVWVAGMTVALWRLVARVERETVVGREPTSVS